LLAFSSHATGSYTDVAYQKDDWLMFGKETDGLSSALLEAADLRLTIPMPRSSKKVPGGVRSLNLSVAVGIVVFEALRQHHMSESRVASPFRGLATLAQAQD
jgi:tRNA (cytidine/uridine-2'-O-)-methyltransferase